MGGGTKSCRIFIRVSIVAYLATLFPRETRGGVPLLPLPPPPFPSWSTFYRSCERVDRPRDANSAEASSCFVKCKTKRNFQQIFNIFILNQTGGTYFFQDYTLANSSVYVCRKTAYRVCDRSLAIRITSTSARRRRCRDSTTNLSAFCAINIQSCPFEFLEPPPACTIQRMIFRRFKFTASGASAGDPFSSECARSPGGRTLSLVLNVCASRRAFTLRETQTGTGLKRTPQTFGRFQPA